MARIIYRMNIAERLDCADWLTDGAGTWRVHLKPEFLDWLDFQNIKHRLWFDESIAFEEAWLDLWLTDSQHALVKLKWTFNMFRLRKRRTASGTFVPTQMSNYFPILNGEIGHMSAYEDKYGRSFENK